MIEIEKPVRGDWYLRISVDTEANPVEILEQLTAVILGWA